MGLFDDAKSLFSDVANSNFVQGLQKNTNTFSGARGGSTAFDKTYQVKQFSYPEDLMDPVGQYGGNYVIFYINVAIDSKLANTAGAGAFVNSGIAPRDRGDLIAQNLDKVTTAASASILTGITGGILGGLLGGKGGASIGALASTVGIGAPLAIAASSTRQTKRLKTAVALHIPNQLNIRYGVNWEGEDTANFAMAAAGGTEVAKALSDNGDAKNLSNPAASIISNLALSQSGQAASAVSAATGLAANPRKEQIFKGVEFRTFAFDYQFFPRSSTEAANILNIIREFKYHMHPEFKDNNNFIYIYPSEFDISYYQGGKENLNLHRHTSCVLTEMNVNYTPNGTFSAFPDGMPTQINVTLNFKELGLLTKDKVKDGM